MNAAITVLLLCAAGGHLAAAVFLASGRVRTGRCAFAGSWAAAAAVLVVNWLAAGEPPLGGIYHVLVAVGCCFLPAWAFLAWKDRLAWPAAAFAGTAVLPLVAALFTDRAAGWRRVPALQSPWFVPHVTAYTLAYCLAGTACLLLVAGLLRHLAKRWRRTPSADVFPRHAAAAHAIVRLAFPFMTVGLCSGALWAEEAWGAWWQWDPKETWSLLTWLLYALALHLHARPRLRPWAPIAQALGFAALLVTFLGVNYVGALASALHGYA